MRCEALPFRRRVLVCRDFFKVSGSETATNECGTMAEFYFVVQSCTKIKTVYKDKRIMFSNDQWVY